MVPPYLFTRTIGNKTYELKDHLGNVRVVISDMKLNGKAQLRGKLDGESGKPNYMADIRSYNNYYPFGMVQPARQWETEGYRYGFNGKEMDNEVHGDVTTGDGGTGNSYDYGARMYDSRLGRWLSNDPLEKLYPAISTYVSNMNNPILFIDRKGTKVDEFTKVIDGKIKTVITITGSVINLSSNEEIDPYAYRDELISRGNDLFEGKYVLPDGTKGEVEVIWNVKVATKISEIDATDHLWVIADFKKDKTTQGVTTWSDQVAYVDAALVEITHVWFLTFQKDGRAAKTGIHEALHMLDPLNREDREPIYGASSIHGIGGRISDGKGGFLGEPFSVFHQSEGRLIKWNFSAQDRGYLVLMARDAATKEASSVKAFNNPLDPGESFIPEKNYDLRKPSVDFPSVIYHADKNQ